jgi:hypothetical protein
LLIPYVSPHAFVSLKRASFDLSQPVLTSLTLPTGHVLFLLDQKGVVVVGSVSNNFQVPEIQGLVSGFPERLADPDDRFHQPNLILACGIDKNSWISPLNAHRSWMALAPGFEIVAASTINNGYMTAHGSSVGKLPFFHSSAGNFGQGQI